MRRLHFQRLALSERLSYCWRRIAKENLRMRFRLRAEKFFRARHASSRKVTSNCQCRWFSIPQCSLILLLKVSLVWLSRGESIGRVLEEMALISLEREDKISLLLDHLFGYFYLRTHSIHRDDGSFKSKLIKEFRHARNLVRLLPHSLLSNAL